MNQDLISRQAAIEALRRAEALTKAFGYHNVIETIRELPSVQPQRWIPCDTRLPDDCQRAICINKHSEMMIGTYTEYGWMFPCYFEKPFAWMPLPEPMRETE